MKLLIAGDLSVQDRASVLVRNNELIEWRGIKELIREHDEAILNLESPITKSTKKIYKDGPYLKNDERVLDILKKYGFGIVTLANNHLKDYGNDGVIDTLEALTCNGIKYVGAGMDLNESKKPLIIDKDGERVAIFSACESELSIATEDTPGAHPLDLVELFYEIPKIKRITNKIIIIIHGGCEHYQLPTPEMKKRYHFIADLGVSAIINHHQHCYSGFEVYNNVPIFYGLGNFYFDNPKKRNSIWNFGLMISLDTTNLLNYNVIPYEQCNSQPVIRLLEPEPELKKIEQINDIIADDKRLNLEFKKELSRKKPLSPFLPYSNHYLRALYHRGLFPGFLSNKRIAEMLNKIRCETHFEILTSVLNDYIKNRTR